MTTQEISVVHLYIYGQLKRELLKSKSGNCLHVSKINAIVKWFVRLPRRYHLNIIDELVEHRCLKKLNRDNYEVLPINTSLSLQDSLGNPLW